MASLQAITKTDFANKSWRRCTNYSFAAQDTYCVLAAQELPQAMLSMPIAFIQDDEGFLIVAVLGLQTSSNFYLDSEGNWLGKYIPARYRSYPFLLVPNTATKDQMVLCIDADSGLVTESDIGEKFFDETGEPSATLTEILNFLTKVSAGQAAAARICESLQKHDLLKPWDMEIQLETGIQRVEGLFCINETALNALSDEDFIEIRKSGALPAIYCQMLSMQHIGELAQVVQKIQVSARNTSVKELNLDSISADGNISFDNL